MTKNETLKPSTAHLEADDVGVALLVQSHKGVHGVGAPVVAGNQQLGLRVGELLLDLCTPELAASDVPLQECGHMHAYAPFSSATERS